MAQHGAAANVAHDNNHRRQPPVDTHAAEAESPRVFTGDRSDAPPSTATAGDELTAISSDMSITTTSASTARWADETPELFEALSQATALPTTTVALATSQSAPDTTEEALPPFVVHNTAEPCRIRWHHHTNQDEPCQMCAATDTVQQRASPKMDAPNEDGDQAREGSTAKEEEMVVDEAGADETASHLSDESFSDIDRQLAYDPTLDEAVKAPTNMPQHVATTVSHIAASEAAADMPTAAPTAASSSVAIPTNVTTSSTSTIGTTTLSVDRSTRSIYRGARPKTRAVASRVKIIQDDQRRHRRRHAAGQSPAHSPARSRLNEPVEVFDFDTSAVNELFPAPPRRTSSETPPVYENLAEDHRFAAIMRQPDVAEEGGEEAGIDTSPPSQPPTTTRVDGGKAPRQTTFSDVAAVLLREPMEAATSNGISMPLTTQPATESAMEARTTATTSLLVREATPPPTAQVSTAPTTTSTMAAADVPAEVTLTTALSDARAETEKPSDTPVEPGEEHPATQQPAGPATRPPRGVVTIHNTLTGRHTSTKN